MLDVLCDTSVLQYLFQCGLLDLLPSIYGSITVPTAVRDEIRAGTMLGIGLPDVSNLSWLQVREPGEHSLMLPGSLGDGEHALLQLAIEREHALLIIDDG